MPPPKALRMWRAFLIKSKSPHIIDPIGDESPLDKQNVIE